ncbi:hypothetical protein ES695_21515 [Candidatus Atribacteria bacterium 1244-E10-H5-B2]|nr:MAG: hypothetical protein ES695_21515 [Candidatus Atribacteria bacterium 1244-E10-H5-B2]
MKKKLNRPIKMYGGNMKGRIKAGEGALIGNAGEYYVMAELLKRGIIAALAPRNAPAFDILATRKKQTVKIRVKTKSQEYPMWYYSVKKDGSIFRNLSKDGDFTVLVDLAMATKDLKFYIVPTHQIDGWLREGFDEWVKTPGKNNRPHDPTNKLRYLIQEKYARELSKYLNQWEKLW